MPELEPSSESLKEAEAKREPREPRALSTEYHKARKQLMLWAGILFIWELVGIDLDKAQSAGGNFGAIIGALKSPQAVPWALLILVSYFVFKLRIEWLQCNQSRRQVREAKQDYYLAFIVAGAASALYFGQAISRVQLADRLGSRGISALGLVTMLIVLALLFSGVFGLINAFRHNKRGIWIRLLQLLFLPIVLVTVKLTGDLQHNSRLRIVVLWNLVGALLFCWPWIQSLRQHRRSGVL